MATDPLFMKIGSEYYFYHNDHIGTPQKLTSVSGAVAWSAKYSSFGETSIDVGTVANNLRFPGQYFDQETGLHYNYHRYYDPATGRYLTADPIGLIGGINLFAYAKNSPMNWIDPLGLEVATTTAGSILGSGTSGAVTIGAGGTLGIAAGLVLGIATPVGEGSDVIPDPYLEVRGEGNDPYTLPRVNPGKDDCGKCKPCPPDGPIWEHIHADGTVNRHKIVYNQNPDTCECFPTRIHLP